MVIYLVYDLIMNHRIIDGVNACNQGAYRIYERPACDLPNTKSSWANSRYTF